jgi:hypothetical protein
VAFLHEMDAHPNPTDWTFWQKARRVQAILDRVITDGQNGTSNDYFIQSVPIFLESDHSYLEAKRISDTMQDYERTLRHEGCWNMVITTLELVLCVTMLSIVMAQYILPLRCSLQDSTRTILFLPLFILSGLALQLSGVHLAIIQFKKLKWKNVVYRIYPWGARFLDRKSVV